MTKHPLKALNIAEIDIDAARDHFDLPIEDQFRSKSELRQGLKSTKDQLLHLLGDTPHIAVYRGMTVPADFMDTLEPKIPVGRCWAWDQDGALKGSGLDSGGASEGDIGIILVATSDANDVNWAFTVAVNTFHEDEKEIVMADDASLSLQKILLVENGKIIRNILPEENRGMEITSSDPVEQASRPHP